MDTTTVLEIIKMIETQKNVLIDDEIMHQEEYVGAMMALRKLQNHLQSFIEAELNKAEQ